MNSLNALLLSVTLVTVSDDAILPSVVQPNVLAPKFPCRIVPGKDLEQRRIENVVKN